MRGLLLLLTLHAFVLHSPDHGSASRRPAGIRIDPAPRVTGAAHGAVHELPSGSARGGSRVVQREPFDPDALPHRRNRDEAIVRRAPPDEALRRPTLPARQAPSSGTSPD